MSTLRSGNPHGSLGAYFAAKENFSEPPSEPSVADTPQQSNGHLANLRKLDELPWQILNAAKRFASGDPQSVHWSVVANLFQDITFLEAKVDGQPGPFALTSDLMSVLKEVSPRISLIGPFLVLLEAARPPRIRGLAAIPRKNWADDLCGFCLSTVTEQALQ